jgi:hypothetical protein
MINSSFDGSFTTTNVGAARKNDLLSYGRAFKLKYFQAGQSGHDPATNLPLAVDVTRVTLENPSTGLIEIPVGGLVQVDFRVTKLSITLGRNVGTGVLSSVGIWGEVISVADPADASLIGNQFLYAICNLGYSLKASNSTRTLNLLLHSV